MVNKVVKKKGEEEPFIKEKLVVEAIELGLGVEESRELAYKIEEHFSNQEKVKIIELREEFLKRLKELNIIPDEDVLPYMELILETERRLNNDPSFGLSETLLLSLDNLKEFNKLSRELGKRRNIKIKEINSIDNDFFIELKIFPVSHSLI